MIYFWRSLIFDKGISRGVDGRLGLSLGPYHPTVGTKHFYRTRTQSTFSWPYFWQKWSICCHTIKIFMTLLVGRQKWMYPNGTRIRCSWPWVVKGGKKGPFFIPQQQQDLKMFMIFPARTRRPCRWIVWTRTWMVFRMCEYANICTFIFTATPPLWVLALLWCGL